MANRYATPVGETVEVRHGLFRSVMSCSGCEERIDVTNVNAQQYATKHAANCRRIPRKRR